MFIKKRPDVKDRGPEGSGPVPLFRQPEESSEPATPRAGWRPPGGEIVDVEDSRIIEDVSVAEEGRKGAPTAGAVPEQQASHGFGKFLGKKQPEAEKAFPERKSLFSKFSRGKSDAAETPGQAAALESKPSRNPFSWFSGGKATKASDAAPKKQPAVKESKSFFSGKPSSKGENATGTPAPSSAPVRKAAPKSSLDVLVELDGNKRVCWRVSASQFEEVDSAQVAVAASFSKNEQRFATEAALSYEQAQNLALSEIGEEVRIVNATKSLKAVYASTAARIGDLGELATGPGLQLVELLLQSERKAGEELVCCLVLTGATESRSLAVLYHFTAGDDVAATQITVNPDNLNFVLSQFAASRRLDGDNTKFVLFKNEDLLRVAGSLALYPREAMWRGISLRRAVWGAAIIAGAAAVVTGLFAGQAWLSFNSLKTQYSAANSEKTATLKKIDELLKTSVVSFAKTQAVAHKQVSARAGMLWSPGSKVTVEASPAREIYLVTLPLTRGAQVGNNPSVLNPITLAKVEPFLAAPAPEGCNKDEPNISGGMNAVQLSVTCENPSSPVSAYSLN